MRSAFRPVGDTRRHDTADNLTCMTSNVLVSDRNVTWPGDPCRGPWLGSLGPLECDDGQFLAVVVNSDAARWMRTSGCRPEAPPARVGVRLRPGDGHHRTANGTLVARDVGYRRVDDLTGRCGLGDNVVVVAAVVVGTVRWVVDPVRVVWHRSGDADVELGAGLRRLLRNDRMFVGLCCAASDRADDQRGRAAGHAIARRRRA